MQPVGRIGWGDLRDKNKRHYRSSRVRCGLAYAVLAGLAVAAAIFYQVNNSSVPSGQINVLRTPAYQSDVKTGETGILYQELVPEKGFTLDDYCKDWQGNNGHELNPVSRCVEQTIRANEDRYTLDGRPLVSSDGSVVQREVADGVPASIRVLPKGPGP